MTLNRKDRIELLIVLLLAVVFIVALIMRVQSMSAKKKPALSPVQPAVYDYGAEILPEGKKEEFIKLDNIARGLALRRDPFSGAQINNSSSDSSSAGFMLSGIFWDENNPCAIINGKVVHAGDSVDGKEVERISRDKVLLNDGNGSLELKLSR